MADPANAGPDPIGRRAREAEAAARANRRPPDPKEPGDLAAYRSIAEKVRETLDNRARQEPIGSLSYSVLAILAGITDAGIAAINEIEAQDEISR